MKQFIIGEKEVNLCTDWNELTLGQLLEFEDCIKNKASFEIDEEFMCRVLEILCSVGPGDLDEMELDQLGDMNESIQLLLKPREKTDPKEVITINGLDYILDRNQYRRRNMKEMKIIGLIRTRFTKEIDLIPRMLAVLIRPGVISKHPETGENVYTLNKLELEDVEPRAEIFMKNAKAVDILEYLSFFLNGNQQ